MKKNKNKMVVNFRQMHLARQTQPKCCSMWFVAHSHFRNNHHHKSLIKSIDSVKPGMSLRAQTRGEERKTEAEFLKPPGNRQIPPQPDK